MAQRHTDPERDELHPPGPEEHPGEAGPLLDAERTRLKPPYRERVQPDDEPPPSEQERSDTTDDH